MSYRNVAFVRWAGCKINGVGRYALVNDRTGDIYLFETLAAAQQSAPFHNCKPIDLAPLYIPTNIPDDWEDALRARREERKSKA
jgi:hypothetical protein